MLRVAALLTLIMVLVVAPAACAGTIEGRRGGPGARGAAWQPGDGRAGAPGGRAGTWQRPVTGPLLRAFALGRNPYAGGWHRGVDLAAARGSPVRSACAGRVSFAGRVPRGGLTLSVRCRGTAATYQQLGSLAVREGADVGRGRLLGTVGRSSDPRQRRSHLHLGARDLATGRYLDPLGLMRAAPPALPLVPPVARTPPRAAPLGPAPRAAPSRVPLDARPRSLPRLAPFGADRAAPRGAPARPTPGPPSGTPARPTPGPPRGAAQPDPGPPEPGVPWLVWVGLACVGLGLPFGGFVRVRRRRRATRRVAQTA